MNIALEGRTIKFRVTEGREQFEREGTFIDSYLGTKEVKYTMHAGGGSGCYHYDEKIHIAVTKYMIEDIEGKLYHIEPNQILKFES